MSPKYNDGHHDECQSDGLDYWCHPDCSHYPVLEGIPGAVVIPLPARGVLPPSQYIKERLKELDMEKHGVAKDETKTKTASAITGKCPQCGGELTKEGDTHIDHCPKCGTEPFERTQD